MNERTRLLRCWMFVPGHRQRMMDKALGLENVDAIMLDVEDGVAPAEKETARRQIAATLDQVQKSIQTSPAPPRTPARYVRINAIGHERMHADLAAVVRPGLEGLVLPKVETAEQVKTVERILDSREPEAGIVAGTVRLLVAIESPRGLFNAYAIAAASPRVTGLIFGAEDYGRELGLPLRREEEARDLVYARSVIANAAAAAHVQSIDGVWPDLQDMEGLRRFALQARRLGFNGISAIHPSQIEPINAVFTPAPDEVDYCRQVVQAFEEAQARGEGSIAFGGQLLDLPIVERARRTLALAESLKM
ncbi:MAG: CoA ester lyase [Acidobacteria bacterium]|nr:CoA ester lyase [Acidobacteriota bacterium]